MEKNQQRTVMIKLFWLCIFTFSVNARIHKLKLENDDRKEITLSTFGFLTKGTLAVYVDSFSISPKELMKSNTTLFVFTLGRSNSVGLSSYMEDMQKTCFLNHKDKEANAVFFHFDFIQKRINIVRGENLKELEISSKRREDFLREHNLNLVLVDGDESQPDVEPKQSEGEVGATVAGVDQVMFTPQTSLASNLTDQGNRTEPAQNETAQISPPIHSTLDSPLLQFVDLVETADGFKGHFLVYIKKSEEEGLYSLLFHNCPSQNLDSAIEISIALTIIEDNNGNFLTAGEMPVPALYFLFCILFFIAAVAWLSVLHSSREDVYKIHYMMLVVVFVKSLACLFHGVNMYFIQIKGIHEEAWAILWYIVYLTRGALMFVTVLLIGAGWAFIKHVLSVKEKKLFLIVIPLQILAQVAEVIVEESEEGGQSYMTWKEIFILVDLLCCGAILFPVVWSIRHLHEASQTDGKAAINLQKLKLFRHFYILVVCYIYFTRIIVYLMKITLPFKFEWLTDLFKELAMLVFFTVTGSKFRPATNNPYLQVPLDSDDEDIEMEEVLTKTGVTEGVVRVNQKQEVVTNQVKQRESSHEYD